jgi:hypothetical protein
MDLAREVIEGERKKDWLVIDQNEKRIDADYRFTE